jgi:DNA primase small subunit
MREEDFLKKKLLEYYSSCFVSDPPSISEREFGIGVFGRKISSRHLSFSDSKNFNSFLRRELPFFVSYSAAYYKNPSVSSSMPAKKLRGADIIYEFDADDIKTDCKLEHDSWFCSCGASGKGVVENCPECGSGVKAEEWVCPKCLGVVKKQVFELLDFLRNDFNINQGISLNFSGSKGFHVHVRNEELYSLSAGARIELVDYLTAFGLDPKYIGFYEDSGKKFVCPVPENAMGWSKRLLDAIKELFESNDAELLAVAGNTTFREAQKLLNEKTTILNGINKGTLYQLPGRRTQKFWNSVLGFLIGRKKLDIDRQTSVDIYKIIRVPETIHGGTMLAAKKVDEQNFRDYDALKEAVVLPAQEVKVKIAKTPRFYLKGQWWGPFDHSAESLPEYVAAYLVAKGKAVLE